VYDLCVKYSEHCLQELKNKEKSSWVIPKVVAVTHGSSRLPELFIPKFKSQFKQGFTKVVLSRAGCLREWLQGELQLYLHYCIMQMGKVMVSSIIIIVSLKQ